MSDHRPGPGWGRGSDGQRATAAVLATLPASFHFVHGLPVGRQRDEVDHLVVGPTGAWVICSDHWTGSVTSTPDGMIWRDQVPITAEIGRLQALAAYARRTLGLEVRPVLCVVGARLPLPEQRIGGVDVIAVDQLVTAILSPLIVLTTDDVDQVMRVAADWRIQPPDHTHPGPRRHVAPPSATVRPTAPATVRPEPHRQVRRDERRARPSSSWLMVVATIVALSMLALIAALLLRDEAPVGLGAIDPVVVAAQSSDGVADLRIEIDCPVPGEGFRLTGHVGALAAGRVRVSAVIDGEAFYVGEFGPLDDTPPIGGRPPGSRTGIDIERVGPSGERVDARHVDIDAPRSRC